MPTILSHAIVPLASGLALGASIVSRRLMWAGIAASMLPDLDVLAFRIGIAYFSPFGHRGFSHSLVFAMLLGMAAALLAKPLKANRVTAFMFVCLSAASHGLLDMQTNGGLGVALAWPFSGQRYFFPHAVIHVSPLSLHRVLGPAGLAAIKSELLWIWLPSALAGLAVFAARRWNAPAADSLSPVTSPSSARR